MGNGTVFWHLLEVARAHTHTENGKPSTHLVSRLSLSLVAMLAQLNDQLFGMPVSLHSRWIHIQGADDLLNLSYSFYTLNGGTLHFGFD